MPHLHSQIPIHFLFLLLSSCGADLKVVYFFVFLIDFFYFVSCFVFDILIPWYLEFYQILISLLPLIFIIEVLYGLSNVTSHILFLLLIIEFIVLDFGVSFGV